MYTFSQLKKISVSPKNLIYYESSTIIQDSSSLLVSKSFFFLLFSLLKDEYKSDELDWIHKNSLKVLHNWTLKVVIYNTKYMKKQKVNFYKIWIQCRLKDWCMQFTTENSKKKLYVWSLSYSVKNIYFKFIPLSGGNIQIRIFF